MAERRLPIYFLVDVSGSMEGAPICAVESCIRQLLQSIATDPCLLDSVFLSLIFFGNMPERITSLVSVSNFVLPNFKCEGLPMLGPALRFLGEVREKDSALREKEIYQQGAERNRDRLPYFFCFTNGDVFSDGMEEGVKRLLNQRWGKGGFFWINEDGRINIGDYVDSRIVFKLEESLPLYDFVRRLDCFDRQINGNPQTALSGFDEIFDA